MSFNLGSDIGPSLLELQSTQVVGLFGSYRSGCWDFQVQVALGYGSLKFVSTRVCGLGEFRLLLVTVSQVRANLCGSIVGLLLDF